MNKLQRVMPWVWGFLAAALVFAVAFRAVSHSSDGAMPLEDLAGLPVSASGRTKPLDTFARTALLSISGRQTFDAGGRSGSAVEWLLEVWTHRDAAADRRVVRIDHPDVLSLLGFQDPGRTRFSFRELQPKFREIARQADMASQVSRKQLDPFQRQILDLYSKLSTYTQIANFDAPYSVAPLAPGQEWLPLSESGAKPGQPESAAGPVLRNTLAAYSAGDGARTRESLRELRQLLTTSLPAEVRAARSEVIFNRCEPFYNASILYVLAFVLGCFALLIRTASPTGWAPSLVRSTFMVLAVAFALHTVGLIARVYLQGRPPVTNLYSSAVFIGWVCVPISLFGERFHRSGLLQLVASLVGFATLVVAHNLSGTGDTMEMMQAVLDSNFWLATHVVVVTIGYSATFLAGFLACLYILAGVLTGLLAGEPVKSLPKMVYGVICFASVTSFVGTVLGGIWADQSWGRFWGWDPKENGAALIVLWNLLILHARWGGMIRERGIAVLAVAGNIVTAWSWFGTNMLGVGLHSYGFMDSAVFWLLAFCIAQLAIMGLAATPTARWRSLSDKGGEPRSVPLTHARGTLRT